MKKVLIFGGTGFLGLHLANHLQELGYTTILVARHSPTTTRHPFISWNGHELGAWQSELENAYAVVNLAGKSVDCIKTPENCDLILRSRVNATRTIGRAISTVQNPPKIWIQMSTAHIYGDPPQLLCDEEAPTGYGLAPFVGKEWEATFHQWKPKHVRGVILRTSFVIGRNGGALATLKRIAKFGLGGTVGHGKQGMSWIHQNDFNRFIQTAIEDESVSGIYNLTAPKPVSNSVFMRTLRKTLRIPIGLPSPAILTRLGAALIFRTDPELALYGRYVIPRRLQEHSFEFQFPTLPEALHDLLRE